MRAAEVSRRAFTLLETLVAVGLSFLVASVLLQLFVSASRAGSRVDSQMILEQTALIAMERLKQDLARTSTAGISWAADASPAAFGLSLQPLAQELGEPRLAYAEKLTVYRWSQSTGELTREELEAADLSFPLTTSRPLDKGAFSPLTLPRAAKQKKMAQFVIGCELTSELPAPNVANPLTLRLHLRREVNGRRPAEYTAMQTFYVRTPSS